MRISALIALMFLLGGCASQRQKYAPIPGCAGVYAEVPEGCYVQQLQNAIEVRCQAHTRIFNCHRP